ncbi:protein SIX6OS1 [Pteropus alecto]|uniref:protein SIX6OS1 n=1 Tax=Pteropus alecto TaxID=9402 RepID=UPI0003F0FC64|nr:protein SIX6OS1 [Pteropus alecto]
MDDSLFVSLDRLLLEFVFQYKQDIRSKEDMIQRINKTFEDVKQYKATICKIHETINTTEEEIGHYRKHSKEINNSCSNWKPTCDVFRKHEDYMQEQFIIYQETIEKDKKMYHGYVCQYKDVLKQYQIKFSEAPLSLEYYQKKREHEEIQNRVLACTEQLKMNESIFIEFLVPAPFPSLTKWTLHMVCLRCKTQDILKHARNFSKISCELKKEVDEVEIEINCLNQQIARLYETKNLSEALEENNKNIENRKELKERIFEKDEHHILSKISQNSQLFLSYEPLKLVRPISMHSSEPRVTDKKEESSVKQSKLANIDFRQKEDAQVFNDSAVSNNSKCSHVMAVKSSQNFLPLRLLTPQKQSNCNIWFEKGNTDAECADKETVRQLRESKCTSQVIHGEHLGMPIDNNEEVEERAENFPRTPEIPLFLRTPEAVKTPESLEKLLFPKTPLFEINRNRHTVPEGQTQKESPGFSFLMSYTARSPGLNLFDSSIFDSEMSSSEQFSENYSTGNLNPLSSQEIGNLFGKPEGEDAFAFSFPSDSSTHTFVAGKDDFSFPFSFEQDQNSTPSSSKDFSSSSQNTTQFTLF